MNNYSLYFFISIIFISCLSIITHSKDIDQHNKNSAKMLMSSEELNFIGEIRKNNTNSRKEKNIFVEYRYKRGIYNPHEKDDYCESTHYPIGYDISVKGKKIRLTYFYDDVLNFLNCGLLNSDQQEELNEIINNWDINKTVYWYPSRRFCHYEISSNKFTGRNIWKDNAEVVPKSYIELINFLQTTINKMPKCPEFNNK